MLDAAVNSTSASTEPSTPTITPTPTISQCLIPTDGQHFVPQTIPWTTQCSDVEGIGDPSATWNQPWYDYTDKCLGEYCAKVYQDFIFYHNVTRLVTQTRPRNSGVYGTGSLSTVIVSELQWTDYATCELSANLASVDLHRTTSTTNLFDSFCSRPIGFSGELSLLLRLYPSGWYRSILLLERSRNSYGYSNASSNPCPGQRHCVFERNLVYAVHICR
jgi:hypothetical protein